MIGAQRPGEGNGSGNAHGDGSARRFESRRCSDSGCGLRFPVDAGSELGRLCPHCGSATVTVEAPFSTHGANVRGRHGDPPDRPCHEPSRHDLEPLNTTPAGPRLAALLDNVRSLRNVGSMLRTADGAGFELVVFGGITPRPDHPKMAKTALGAERTVPWRGFADARVAAAALAGDGWSLWALEGGPRSQSLFDPELLRSVAQARIVLVLGHELAGVDPRIVDLCERVVHLPMLGHKGSLNVSVAFGAAAYALRFSRLGERTPLP